MDPTLVEERLRNRSRSKSLAEIKNPRRKPRKDSDEMVD